MKTPTLVTVANVPLLEVGVEYTLSSGNTTFTPEDLRDVVTAANEDHSIPAPRAGIGHIDPRYNDTGVFDGSPAFGKYVNLRLSENGMVVYADWVGCPKWLADIGPAAYPGRSIEGFWNVRTQAGHMWRFVLSSVKSLGVTWPGVSVLEDLPMWFGDEQPDGVVIDAEAVLAKFAADALVAASSQPGGDPVPTQASANLDDVRRAFYMQYVPENTDARYWWVRAVLTDPNQLVVEDDEDGQLFLLSFSSNDDGEVSFGDPSAVRIDYVPDKKAAASHVAAALAVGRKVAASWPTRAESCPTTASTGGAMDPKQIREALGLPEDASDEQVQATLLDKAGITAASTEEPPAPAAAPAVVPAEQGGTTPVSTGTPEPVAAGAALQLPPGSVLVDEQTWKETQAGLGEFREFRKSQAEKDRTTLVAAAVGDGRIPRSREAFWLEYLERDPEGGKAALAAFQPGSAVPVTEIGHGGGNLGDPPPEVVQEQELVENWTSTLFPETRATRELDRQIHAGAAHHPLVAADNRYRGIRSLAQQP